MRDGSELEVSAFARELRERLAGYVAAEKRGVWLRLPMRAHRYVSAAASAGFRYHHATDEYVQLTRWLPATPSPLPRYAFTLVGVGGVLVSAKGEVLLVQERVSPSARMQGAWKLPGGLAEPGEEFAATVVREVMEETGVAAELDGVVSLRHSHGRRFGQGDLYVVVRLRATSEAIRVDAGELLDARWMSVGEIEARKERPEDKGQPLDGKVSLANWEMIQTALSGKLIEGVSVPNSKGEATMLYRG